MDKAIPLIDWAKAIGIFLIVFGHLDGDWTNTLTMPIRLKQLGVVLFVFIMGWQLSRDKRQLRLILFNRLFKLYFWSFTVAVLMSLIGIVCEGKIYKSNYMPFLAGVNVLFDFFPANPTTWFIGTYLHLLILWAIFLRKVNITKTWIVISLAAEIVARGILMNYGFSRAYMLVFNWQTVFFLGMYLGQRDESIQRFGMSTSLAVYATFIVLWAMAVFQMTMAPIFPFRIVQLSDAGANNVLTSFLVSLVYLGHAFCFYHVARHLPANRITGFFSRNSLIIFLAHMPLWYFIAPHMKAMIESHPVRLIADLAILYLGIGLVSSLLLRFVPVDRIKTLFYQRTFYRSV